MPKNLVSRSCTMGMRVWPPTSITSSMSAAVTPASTITEPRILRVRSTSGWVSFSSSFRSNLSSRLSGCPCAVMVMKGMEKGASARAERSILVRSARSLMRCMATGSVERSMPCRAWKPSSTWRIMALSKSMPPRKMSPPVALTSKTRSRISMMETSKVPPPRS